MQNSSQILAYFLKRLPADVTCLQKTGSKKALQTPEDAVTEIQGRPEWPNRIFATILPLPRTSLCPGCSWPHRLCTALRGGLWYPKSGTETSGDKGSFFVLSTCPFVGEQCCTMKVTWGRRWMLWNSVGCTVSMLKHWCLAEHHRHICKLLSVHWSVLSEETRVNVRP